MRIQLNSTRLHLVTLTKNFNRKIKTSIDTGIETFTSDITHPYTVRLLRKVVYLWFLINTIILLPMASEFWGAEALIPKIESSVTSHYRLLYLLQFSFFAPYYKLFICLQIILLILGILCVYSRIISILIYFFTINLDNKAFVILDGGNNLMQLILLYLIFMDPTIPKNKYKSQFINHLNNSLSNASFYMVRLQIVIVYLVSGLGKVAGTLWQNGTALYYTLNVDEYSNPFAKHLISLYPIFSVIGTYATMIYQICFPWLIWNRKIRPYLLAFGTFIHIQISFVMGLFMFGLAIATSYLSFMPNDAARKVLNAVNIISIKWKYYSKGKRY
ncbi:MAG: hypothetical protein JWQ09_4445 [Segetibacter sp.]|nr:hypothetical protein [Segetibacter sp.]